MLLIDDSCDENLLRFFLLRNDLSKGTDVYSFCIDDTLDSNEFKIGTLFEIEGVNIHSFTTGSRSNLHIIQYASQISSNTEYLLYSHHDVCNLSKNAYSDLNKELLSSKYQKVGLIGFNIFHDSDEMNCYSGKDFGGSDAYSTTSRCALQRGDGYYRRSIGSRVNYNNFIDRKPFVIEIPFWVNCIINKKNFQTFVDIDKEFDFHLAFDYIAMRFLQKNIPNICIPYISFAHQQEIKVLFNKRVKSPFPDSEKVQSGFGRQDAHLKWLKEFGFPFNFEKVFFKFTLNHHYICKYLGRWLCRRLATLNTRATQAISRMSTDKLSKLQRDFYLHDSSVGPKNYF